MITPREFAQQMINLQKISFFSCYDAASKIQGQATSAVDTLLDQAIWIPEEGRRAISSWAGTYQKEYDRFKSYVEKSFTSFEKVFSEDPVAKPAKKKKPSTAKTKKAKPAKPIKTESVEAEKPASAETKKTGALEAEKTSPVQAKSDSPAFAKNSGPSINKGTTV